MESWKSAALDFLKHIPFRDDIEAAFLTGSYAVGNSDIHSDIDLYIVLNDNIAWRERGNKRVNGFLIEYFANPAWKVVQLIDAAFDNVRLVEIKMILSGIIVASKNSAAEKLKEYCRQKDMNNFPAMNEGDLKMGLYRIWDNFDELTRAHSSKSADFMMQYHMFVFSTFEIYSRYIKCPVPGYHHLFRWLTDEMYSLNFGLPAYMDDKFLDMVKAAISSLEVDAAYSRAEELKEYVLAQMGGLDIDNFVFRSSCLR